MRKFFLFFTLLFTYNVNSQSFVSTLPEYKKVILEVFTGSTCSFCVDGHVIAQQIIDNNPGNVFIISIHAGAFAYPDWDVEDFRTEIGTTLDFQTGMMGYPEAMINRDGSQLRYNRGVWANQVNQRLQEQSPLNVGVQANIDSTNKLIVDVEVYFTGTQTVTTNQLHVAVVQNNIEGYQSGSSANPSQVLSNGNYSHQNVFRHLITNPNVPGLMSSVTWGDTISTITQGTLFANQYTWQLPTDINGIDLDPLNLSVIAFVSEGNQVNDKILSGNQCIPNVMNTTSIYDFVEEKKRLINVVDVLGRQSKELKNQPLFYIYDDGTVEKKIILE